MRYLGGKSRIAKKIATHLTSHGRPNYVEPFVGGGAVLTATASSFSSVVACDLHPDVIAMFQALQKGWTPPEVVTEDEYRDARKWTEPSALRGFIGFACSFGGKWFGGYARGQAADGTWRGYAAESGRSLAKSAKAGMFDDHVEFRNMSVFDFQIPTDADLSTFVIYCDPPYANTTKYATGDFDHDAFAKTVRQWADQGAIVYVSEYTNLDGWEVVEEYRPQASLNNPKGEATGKAPETLFRVVPSTTTVGA